jgi:hypothetical protein
MPVPSSPFHKSSSTVLWAHLKIAAEVLVDTHGRRHVADIGARRQPALLRRASSDDAFLHELGVALGALIRATSLDHTVEVLAAAPALDRPVAAIHHVGVAYIDFSPIVDA